MTMLGNPLWQCGGGGGDDGRAGGGEGGFPYSTAYFGLLKGGIIYPTFSPILSEESSRC